MRQPCAAFPTLRASQVGSCGAAATSSLKVVCGSLRFKAISAASAFSGPSQASARFRDLQGQDFGQEAYARKARAAKAVSPAKVSRPTSNQQAGASHVP